MLNFAQIPLLNKTTYFDDDFQAWLDRGSTLGYSLPSYQQQLVLNDFFIALKEEGLWTKFDIMYWFAIDGDSDMATINLKAPSSYQCTKISSPTFTSNQGFTWTANGYLSTNFNCSTNGVNYTQNDANRSAYVLATGSGTPLDGVEGSLANRMALASVTGQRINQGTTNLSSAASLTGTGYKAITRTSSTAVEVYNETTQNSRTATSSAMVNATQNIGRSSGVNGTGMTVSFYGLGASLTSTQHGTLRTLIINLIAVL